MQEGTYDKEKFVATLKGKGIDTVLRYTEEGRIYGTTFIDHRTGCVCNIGVEDVVQRLKTQILRLRGGLAIPVSSHIL